MKFYAYYRIPIAEGEHPSKAGLAGITNIMRIAMQSIGKRQNASCGNLMYVKSIVELHLCKELLKGIASELGSKVEFEDGEYCFSCCGIKIWCDNSLSNNEMVVVCK